MRFGLNTFLYASPFTNESVSMFKKLKKWGFDTVEIAIEDPGFDHRVPRNLERIVLSGAEQGGRDGKRRLALQSLDRGARGNAAVERQLDHVIGRLDLRGAGCGHLHHIVAGRGAAGGRRVARLADHLKRARPVGQAAQEAAFLKRHDQAVDAGLGLKVECFLHFLEGGWYAFFLQPFVDEQEEFELLPRQHGPVLSMFVLVRDPESEQIQNNCIRTRLVLQVFTFRNCSEVET